MGIKVRPQYYGAYTDIVSTEISKTSKLASTLMGLDVQVNKAITGENAFAHSSGIHQDGLLKSRDVYEIINPEDLGYQQMELVLTAHSGRHAFRNAINKIGVEIEDQDEFTKLFQEYLELADKKKEVYYHDLFYMVENFMIEKEGDSYREKNSIKLFELNATQVVSNEDLPTATVQIKRGEASFKDSATGDGPIDALYTVIRKITGFDVELLEYKISSNSRREDDILQLSLW